MKASKKLLIVDGFSILFKAHYAFINNPLVNSKGFETSALLGFFNSLYQLIDKVDYDYFILALDSEGPTFRSEIYSAYKAHRPPIPDSFKRQLEALFDHLEDIGIPFFFIEGYEADDIIGSYAKKSQQAQISCEIFSNDKDLMQLVSENVKIINIDHKKNEIEVTGRNEVFEKFEVFPEQIIDFLALMGDSADNIPGVRGVGKKSAAKLLKEYQTLENIYKNLENITAKALNKNLSEGKENAFLSKSLVAIDLEIASLPAIESFVFKTVTKRGMDFLEDLEIYNVLKRFSLSHDNLHPLDQKKNQKKKRN